MNDTRSVGLQLPGQAALNRTVTCATLGEARVSTPHRPAGGNPGLSDVASRGVVAPVFRLTSDWAVEASSGARLSDCTTVWSGRKKERERKGETT
jgi:hypothetical protein